MLPPLNPGIEPLLVCLLARLLLGTIKLYSHRDNIDAPLFLHNTSATPVIPCPASCLMSLVMCVDGYKNVACIANCHNIQSFGDGFP